MVPELDKKKKRAFFMWTICFLFEEGFSFTTELGRKEVDDESVDSASDECCPEYHPGCTRRDHCSCCEWKWCENSEKKTSEKPWKRKTKNWVNHVCSRKSYHKTDEHTISDDCPHHRASPDIRSRTRSQPSTDKSREDTEREGDKESPFTCS